MTGEQGGRVIKKIIQTLLLIPGGGEGGNVSGGGELLLGRIITGETSGW